MSDSVNENKKAYDVDAEKVIFYLNQEISQKSIQIATLKAQIDSLMAESRNK